MSFYESDRFPVKNCIVTDTLRTRSSAIAEGLRDVLVSRNLATTKHPI